MASTDHYPGHGNTCHAGGDPRRQNVPTDGVPDAYRLHPSGLVVYRGHGQKWCSWDSKLPLVNPPDDEAIAAATPLFLSGQAVTP